MPVKSGTKRAEANSKRKPAENYRHPESESLMRPEVGTQAQFKKKLPPGLAPLPAHAPVKLPVLETTAKS